MKTYSVIEGSKTAHCCFEASVVDENEEVIAECFSMEDAELICNALNNPKGN